MIPVADALAVHIRLIEQFGGSTGVRDLGALSAALVRPFQTFDNKELYASPIEKAAALLESLLMNHPFIDGNKRTAYVLMRLLLMRNGLDLKASQQEKYDFVLAVISGSSNFEQSVNWLRSHIVPLS
ncbi:death on curing protein [Cnuella takakiae]|uniref:Death on curing protein n=1 Tax=Cnuella takakiae TaxID=1302690 RepID=A0A1M5F5Q7_9BACT|nr:type II toxin-antitoxin system death-on-curing family toxin [Cnuella takakiae]OLY90985.1 death-on-curing protein [Cnuella takakiae]SHF86846.1 death on curing protein [Cnuella takakiae]